MSAFTPGPKVAAAKVRCRELIEGAMTRAEAVQRINEAYSQCGRGGVGMALNKIRRACLAVVDEVAAEIREDYAEDARTGWETKGEMRAYL